MQSQNELSVKAIQFLKEVAEKGVSNTVDEIAGVFYVMLGEYEFVYIYLKCGTQKRYAYPECSEKEQCEYLKIRDYLLRHRYVSERVGKDVKSYQITPEGYQAIKRFNSRK